MSEVRYITRGAVLKCDCGSHVRFFNLPKDHGEYIVMNGIKYPLVGEKDCEVGENGNIRYFGVCTKLQEQCAEGTYVPPEDPERIVQPEVEGAGAIKQQVGTISLYRLSDDGKTVEVVTGIKCCPQIVGERWRDTKEDAFMWCHGETLVKRVTTESKLYCKYGGVITVLDEERCGINYDGSLDS